MNIDRQPDPLAPPVLDTKPWTVVKSCQSRRLRPYSAVSYNTLIVVRLTIATAPRSRVTMRIGPGLLQKRGASSWSLILAQEDWRRINEFRTFNGVPTGVPPLFQQFNERVLHNLNYPLTGVVQKLRASPETRSLFPFLTIEPKALNMLTASSVRLDSIFGKGCYKIEAKLAKLD